MFMTNQMKSAMLNGSRLNKKQDSHFWRFKMKFQFVQPIYYHYEIEADSLEEAYAKTSELGPDDWYDETVGDWEECSPQNELIYRG